VSLDGIKIHANASKHQATSLKRARAKRKRLEAEEQQLLARRGELVSVRFSLEKTNRHQFSLALGLKPYRRRLDSVYSWRVATRAAW